MNKTFAIQAPALLGGSLSEATVLGSAVWLWMHSPRHRDAPLHTLPTLLLPAIKCQQYALFCLNGTPHAWLSWMWLDEAAEHQYLTDLSIMTRSDEWSCGPRLWIRELIAPFGDLRQIRRQITRTLFPEHCFRWLDHRGDERGLRAVTFKGDSLSLSDLSAWRQAHPLAAPAAQRRIRE